jgi:amino acid adenylation domain-containing protein
MQNAIEGYRLAPQQRRLCSIGEEVFNGRALCAILLEGKLGKEFLKKALHEAARRHTVLRTSYHHQPGLKFPIQVIAAEADVFWHERDLSDETKEEQQRLFEEFWQVERRLPADAESVPLRACLFRYSTYKHLLVVSVPALSADYLTMANLVREISRLYASDESAGDEPVQYVQISEWQNELLESDETGRGEEHWKSQYSSAPTPLILPLAKQPSPEIREACYDFEIEANMLTRCQTPAPVFLLACWKAVLYRLTGLHDVVVSTYFEGRKFEELSEALGLFASWLPLHSRLDGEMKFEELLRQVGQSMQAASAWQEHFTPQIRDGESRPVAFSYRQWPAMQHVSDLTFSLHRQDTLDEQFSIKIDCVRRDNHLNVELHYDANRYDEAAIANVAGYFRTLLAAAIDNVETEVGALAILSASEQKRLVEEWNQTTAPYPHESCMHELFEAQVALTPEAIAVRDGVTTLTYAELNRDSNRLAHYLHTRGVGPESRVGILLKRSTKMLVALLGVLKAGAAYVPLDARDPVERLRLMYADAGVSVLLTQDGLGDFDIAEEQKIDLEKGWAQLERHNDSNPTRRAVPDNLAYIIYTSGSTGVPKGVMISHRGLVNYLTWAMKTYAISGGTGAPVHSPLGFDLTVTSLFVPLTAGSSVLMLPESHGITPLAALLQSERELSLVKLTPAHLELLEQTLPSECAAGRTRAFIVGGEMLRNDTLNFWRTHASSTRIINEYGPTETVVGCCVYEVPAGSSVSSAVPIGKPIANMEMYVLDERLQPAPVGVTGELYIGGIGVARGYVNQPALTAEKFVPHPFSYRAGARLYRTGDLGRYLPDGDLEFLGRRDTQVKIRGFRIELGEIESILRQHKNVREAVAVAAHVKDSGERQLLAYVVERSGAALSPGELRRHLREKLPEHMIPAAFVKLEAFPLTHNGKVDRRMLPDPSEVRYEPEALYTAPQTELERIIAQAWQQVLHIERVGVHDNFFDLGGNSFHVLKVSSSLMEEFDEEVSAMDMFRWPTVSLLAKHLSGEQAPAAQQVQSRASTRKNLIKHQRQQRAHSRKATGK